MTTIRPSSKFFYKLLFVQSKTARKKSNPVFVPGSMTSPSQMKGVRRMRELDFLRGMAILLVLCRHQHLFRATTTMGWIGVDLFFVLSGFLVSGLLFKEYQKYGNIQPKRFLIRRGFKIYPIYYLFYLPYLALLLSKGDFMSTKFLGDMFFVQNYVNGFGYGYPASWSLAIEEHFYFGFAICLFWALKRNWIVLSKEGEGSKFKAKELWVVVAFFMLACLLIRIPTNLYLPEKYLNRSFTMTHLRIDSLLAGVLISYFYYFKPKTLKAFYQRFQYVLLAVAFLCLAWTPFIEPIEPLFIRTIGFTLLYIGFGILLLCFLLNEKINDILDMVFSSVVVNFISKIGFCSYSIYVIHTLTNTLVHDLNIDNNFIEFFVSTGISVSLGFVMTHYIEKYFLKVRDKFCPNRTI